jgi:hypothetical protein
MFLGQVMKLRNIKWVLMFLGPTEEQKRPICESHPFFHSSPFSPLFCAPLPAPHAPATPALPRPRPVGQAPPYPDPSPPCLGRALVARPHPTVCTGRRPHLPRPRPAQQCAPVVGPTPPSSACQRPWPALPRPCSTRQRTPTARQRPAPPCSAHRVGGQSPPAPSPPVRAELLFVLIFFLD